MALKNRILMAVSEPTVLDTVRGVVEGYGVWSPVDGPAALLRRGTEPCIAGSFVYIPRGGESAWLDPLASLRSRRPLLPVLVCAEGVSVALLNALHASDMELVGPPVRPDSLHRFIQRAMAFGQLPDEAVARWVAELASIRKLTAREVQLVNLSLSHQPRARMRKHLGITENTLKTQVRGLLRKCGESSLDGLAKNLLRTALLSARPGADDAYRAPWCKAGAV